MPNFSVCMSVYRNDNPQDFRVAIMSIYKQTVPPDEIILVIDGPIKTILQRAIDEITTQIPILKIIPLHKNMGHAIARQAGLSAARNELVAVMDADDISLPNRFELQLEVFRSQPDVSVVGGLIHEFVHREDNVVGVRMVPEKDEDIKEYLKSRAPVNLVTVMLRKSHVMDVGGYLDWYHEEDYYLWIRLVLAGYKFYNIQENLVNVRVGEEMYQRRGGMKYFKSEKGIQRLMLDNNLITRKQYTYNVAIRLIVQVMMPNWLRGWVFCHFARKQ